MRHNDQKIYRTFEEFEREELRRVDSVDMQVDAMIAPASGDELDFEPPATRKRRSRWEEEDDDEE
jgi:hypothetical protein